MWPLQVWRRCWMMEMSSENERKEEEMGMSQEYNMVRVK
jgi:hypothetical protein